MQIQQIRESLMCGMRGHKCTKGKVVHCPVHDPEMTDKTPSLSVNEVDGEIKVNCFNDNGCTPAEIKKLLGLSNGGKGSYKVTKGLTLEALAKTKALDLELLKEWGWRTSVTGGVSKVVMPYFNIDGEKLHDRYRHNLTDDQGLRFSYEKGAHAALYGLHKLTEIHKRGYCLFVEGETDTITGWQNHIPTLGVPGKTNWQDPWADLTKDIDNYLWVEPEASDFVRRVASSVPDIKVIIAELPIKDINQAEIMGMDVKKLVANAMRRAIPCSQYLADLDQDLYNKALPVIQHPNPFELVKLAIYEQGWGGSPTKPLIIYLATTSRLLKLQRGSMPVHILLLGESSVGKNFTIDVAVVLTPEGVAYDRIRAGSATALIHGKYVTEHAAIIYGEADSLPLHEDTAVASAMRNLTTDGVLEYDVVERDESGHFVTVRKRHPGPTVLITTSTKPLDKQMMTRLFTLDLPVNDRHINDALDRIVETHKQGQIPDPPEALVAYQAYLQSKAPWSVVIPFFDEIRDNLPRTGLPPRILRDINRLISFIQSVAIFNHPHREIDDQGRVIASIEDYRFTYDLINDMFAGTVTGVTPSVTRVVDAVESIKAENDDTTIGYATIGKKVGGHRQQIKRDVDQAIHFGWLVDKETRANARRDIVLGDPMPMDMGLLDPDKLCHDVTENPLEIVEIMDDFNPSFEPHRFIGAPVPAGFQWAEPEKDIGDLFGVDD